MWNDASLYRRRASIPVTVIEVLPNRITQVKTAENDGYNAIQVTTGEQEKRNRVN